MLHRARVGHLKGKGSALYHTTMPDLPLDDLEPHPDNRSFTTDADPGFAALVESIKALGVQSPVLVRRHAGAYQILGGHRRCAAAKAAGLTVVPCHIRDLSDEEALSLLAIDNAHRLNPSGMDWFRMVQRMREEGHTRKHVGAVMGKSEAWVAQVLRIASLPVAIQTSAAHERWTLNRLVLTAKGRPLGSAAKPATTPTPPEAVAVPWDVIHWLLAMTAKHTPSDPCVAKVIKSLREVDDSAPVKPRRVPLDS